MRRKGIIIVALVCVGAVVFVFAPIIYSPIQRPNQLAFLGSIPAYESPSCAVFGFGESHWVMNSVVGEGRWSYQMICPTYSGYELSGP
jgi:hypothetical protein